MYTVKGHGGWDRVADCTVGNNIECHCISPLYFNYLIEASAEFGIHEIMLKYSLIMWEVDYVWTIFALSIHWTLHCIGSFETITHNFLNTKILLFKVWLKKGEKIMVCCTKLFYRNMRNGWHLERENTHTHTHTWTRRQFVYVCIEKTEEIGRECWPLCM